ncbi:hypothetical protein Pmar_PMAR015577 [Perkinsus marinus ATCC 50983]|uniref:Uncharacterized protein n=1 Tax=Perkinsus marinus (strain ATCC 50983 / TXsc) TaxID=423536 RepID=C5KUI3_PERM5|nr:hypothetical protein Pmar_PMAR015577 [Perkinsus marinus ATCC 50983]EER11870.1 hypothetical protein Pmar_PMAR015577 [Perkinsus marinus ATCC 50983]|eukprot:XP_002780075.1 hypothetical protein Pmar_PMAR015577 [Perkinsus marinus ATCC 50983]
MSGGKDREKFKVFMKAMADVAERAFGIESSSGTRANLALEASSLATSLLNTEAEVTDADDPQHRQIQKKGRTAAVKYRVVEVLQCDELSDAEVRLNEIVGSKMCKRNSYVRKKTVDVTRDYRCAFKERRGYASCSYTAQISWSSRGIYKILLPYSEHEEHTRLETATGNQPFSRRPIPLSQECKRIIDDHVLDGTPACRTERKLIKLKLIKKLTPAVKQQIFRRRYTVKKAMRGEDRVQSGDTLLEIEEFCSWPN